LLKDALPDMLDFLFEARTITDPNLPLTFTFTTLSSGERQTDFVSDPPGNAGQ
jgi:hypothetical protein